MTAPENSPLFLELELENGPRHCFEFGANDDRAFVVGSIPQADLRLARDGVPPVAFHLEREGDAIYLTPGYGTELCVNAQLATRRTELTHAAVLEFQNITLKARIYSKRPLSEPPYARTTQEHVRAFLFDQPLDSETVRYSVSRLEIAPEFPPSPVNVSVPRPPQAPPASTLSPPLQVQGTEALRALPVAPASPSNSHATEPGVVLTHTLAIHPSDIGVEPPRCAEPFAASPSLASPSHAPPPGFSPVPAARNTAQHLGVANTVSIPKPLVQAPDAATAPAAFPLFPETSPPFSAEPPSAEPLGIIKTAVMKRPIGGEQPAPKSAFAAPPSAARANPPIFSQPLGVINTAPISKPFGVPRTAATLASRSREASPPVPAVSASPPPASTEAGLRPEPMVAAASPKPSEEAPPRDTAAARSFDTAPVPVVAFGSSATMPDRPRSLEQQTTAFEAVSPAQPLVSVGQPAPAALPPAAPAARSPGQASRRRAPIHRFFTRLGLLAKAKPIPVVAGALGLALVLGVAGAQAALHLSPSPSPSPSAGSRPIPSSSVPVPPSSAQKVAAKTAASAPSSAPAPKPLAAKVGTLVPPAASGVKRARGEPIHPELARAVSDLAAGRYSEAAAAYSALAAQAAEPEVYRTLAALLERASHPDCKPSRNVKPSCPEVQK